MSVWRGRSGDRRMSGRQAARGTCGLRVILALIDVWEVVLPFAGTWEGSSAMTAAIEDSCGPHVIASGSMTLFLNARPRAAAHGGPDRGGQLDGAGCRQRCPPWIQKRAALGHGGSRNRLLATDYKPHNKSGRVPGLRRAVRSCASSPLPQPCGPAANKLRPARPARWLWCGRWHRSGARSAGHPERKRGRTRRPQTRRACGGRSAGAAAAGQREGLLALHTRAGWAPGLAAGWAIFKYLFRFGARPGLPAGACPSPHTL